AGASTRSVTSCGGSATSKARSSASSCATSMPGRRDSGRRCSRRRGQPSSAGRPFPPPLTVLQAARAPALLGRPWALLAVYLYGLLPLVVVVGAGVFILAVAALSMPR